MSRIVAPGLTARTALTALTAGRSSQRDVDAFSAGAELRDRITWRRRASAGPRAARSTGAAPRAGCVELDRQHFGDRRAGPAAFGKRPAAAEHQQAAAALADEVGQHPELIGRERRGLDAAEDDRAIREQLFARLREAADQLVGAADVEPQVLVFGRPLQDDDLQVLVVLDGAADELHFEARLALEVEHLLAAVGDLDERVAHVVLRDLFVGLRRNLEPEQPRRRRRWR